MTKILGINDGYAATVSLMENGRITRMAGEERFTRIKNHSGFPEKALAWLLEDAALSASDIDAVAYSTRSATIKVDAPFNTFRHKFFSTAANVIPGVIASRAFIDRGVDQLASQRAEKLENCPFLKKYGLQTKTRKIYDHHDCHIYSAYLGSGLQNTDIETLIISYDGSGDGYCCRVFLAKNGRLEPIHNITSYHSLGILYSRITEFMGMKPMEHEYKVMGMAPYASPERSEKVYDILKDFVRLADDGLSTVNVSRTWGNSMIEKLHRKLKGHRFDWVAGGAQLHFERVMQPFITNWVKKTNTRSLVLGGGCFMNVKLNMLLSQSDEIDNLYILPSCGDESLSMGAAYMMNEELSQGTSQLVNDLYWGNQCSEEEIQQALAHYKNDVEFRATEDPETEVAKLLADNKIVARCKGRMEWGSRALGNRSILANPASMTTINRINKAIKMRDFWMPFAPSILYERRKDYVENPLDRRAPYMIIAFPSTELAYKEMPAALHPFDLTCRPHIVEKEMNPSYHKLISIFEQLTGTGGVMNTSFNLHGEPIVCSALDAIYTFVHSDLDALALENYIVYRKDRPM